MTDNDVLINVRSVGKKFCCSLKHTMSYGLSDIIRSFFGVTGSNGQLRKGEFWAVDDASFSVKRGECLGLIGPNGSGKSTLLKMLNGIFMPDKGSIMINGRIGALIEVGAGFHPLLTGRENIYVNGAILGMGKREINGKIDAILDFAGIGDFIDTPVKHYSSGMYVRLGFAIASQLKPQILLIDEVLAVGDINFQIKCMNHVNELLSAGSSVIIVSHNVYHIQRMCEKCILLEAGKVVEYGNSASVVNVYEQKYSWLTVNDKMLMMLNNSIEFVSAHIFPQVKAVGHECVVETGKSFSIKLVYRVLDKLDRGLQIGFLVKTSDGQRVSGGTTKYRNFALDSDAGLYSLTLEIEKNELLQGNYVVSFSAFDEQYVQQYGAWEYALKFRVVTSDFNGLHAIGVMYLPSQIRVEKIANS